MSKKDLLFEIGCEEIPVDYIQPAIEQMKKMLAGGLKDNRLTYNEIQTEATPRRFVLIVKELDGMQPTVFKEMMGPKKEIAFKDETTLTPAGQGFLKKVGLTQEQIEFKDGRLFAKIEEVGQSAEKILPEILSTVIKKTTFPKSMRWEASGARFARPLRWLVVLLGDQPIKVSFADVSSGTETQLHPLEIEKKQDVKNLNSYHKVLKNGHVMLSVAERKAVIAKLLDEEAANHNGTLIKDDSLLDMVTMMVEWPGVVAGSIQEKFMAMPPEIITTAMREHQRYFAVEDQQGNLKPLFLTVHDNPTGKADSIRPGCERVLEARLKDAEFFYNEDLKVSLKDKVAQLERVLWIKGLGNLLDKTKRLQSLAIALAEQFEPSCKAHVEEAAYLCKADLITNMIQEKEFNKLQGFMGGVYASSQGANEAVALACQEQYKPRWTGDQLPQSAAGKILALADKLDNLLGCWGAGFAPTGAKDPYALRRAVQGIIAILLDTGYRCELKNILQLAIKGFEIFNEKEETIIEEVKQFVQGRLETELAQRSIQPDLIQAVLNVWWDDITALVKKAEAIYNLRTKEGFNDAITTFSRVVNILPKQTDRIVDPGKLDETVDETLFREESEKKLYQAYQNVGQQVSDLALEGNYIASFEKLGSLKSVIDTFFEKVMVMDKDEAVKQNRIRLLTNIARKIWSLADFSRLVIKE